MPAPAPGPPGRLTPAELLKLRARGLGFLAPHCQVKELDGGEVPAAAPNSPGRPVYGRTIRGVAATCFHSADDAATRFH